MRGIAGRHRTGGQDKWFCGARALFACRAVKYSEH